MCFNYTILSDDPASRKRMNNNNTPKIQRYRRITNVRCVRTKSEHNNMNMLIDPIRKRQFISLVICLFARVCFCPGCIHLCVNWFVWSSDWVSGVASFVCSITRCVGAYVRVRLLSVCFAVRLFFCSSTLRAPLAETRLTVYRRLNMQNTKQQGASGVANLLQGWKHWRPETDFSISSADHPGELE